MPPTEELTFEAGHVKPYTGVRGSYTCGSDISQTRTSPNCFKLRELKLNYRTDSCASGKGILLSGTCNSHSGPWEGKALKNNDVLRNLGIVRRSITETLPLESGFQWASHAPGPPLAALGALLKLCVGAGRGEAKGSPVSLTSQVSWASCLLSRVTRHPKPRFWSKLRNLLKHFRRMFSLVAPERATRNRKEKENASSWVLWELTLDLHSPQHVLIIALTLLHSFRKLWLKCFWPVCFSTWERQSFPFCFHCIEDGQGCSSLTAQIAPYSAKTSLFVRQPHQTRLAQGWEYCLLVNHSCRTSRWSSACSCSRSQK